jgi:streptogrisin C
MKIKSKYLTLLVTMIIIITVFSGFGVNSASINNPDLLENPALFTATSYANSFNVTLDEAKYRLELQPIIGEFDNTLRNIAAETFAGLWIEHEPMFRVVVLFTENGENTVQSCIPPELVGKVQVKTAEKSYTELEKIQVNTTFAIEDLGIPVESGIDVYENRVKLYVTEQDKLNSALQNNQLKISNKVDIKFVNSLSKPETDIYGGLTLNYNSNPHCTSGFSWTDGVSTRGISTAGHCENSLSYNGSALTYIAGYTSGNSDVQFHTVPAGYTVTNKIQYYPGYTCNITGTLGRSSQSVGMYVAKYGMATGRTAGLISNLSYWPYGYSNTFIEVNNTWGGDLSSAGDSGGPWYDGYYGTAYGIHHAESANDSNDAVYMAVNYMESLGFLVLTSP